VLVLCSAVLSAPSQESAAVVRSLRILPEQNGPVVEITSTRPIVPAIQKIEGPSRLVVDLPGTNFSLPRKRYAVSSAEVSGVRVDQFEKAPPVTRVVIDLLKPIKYSWDANGNRLMIRLHPGEEVESPSLPLSTPTFTQGVQASVVPSIPGASGTLVQAGSRISAGSSLTAGADTAILNLTRGGEVRVCPGTTVSVTTSRNGQDLMLGMSTGAVETHYTLNASADSVITPDFRIALAGPGEFHYAMSADSRGNTCVRALPGNTAPVNVSELTGESSYEVKPTEQIIFKAGHINLMEAAGNEECGCPPPEIPVMLASGTEAPAAPEEQLPANARMAQPGDPSRPLSAAVGDSNSSNAAPPLPASPSETPGSSQPNQLHVQVEAPIVFRAADLPAAPAAPNLQSQPLPLADSKRPVPVLTIVVSPEDAQSKPQRRGFFGRIKGFFSSIFG
jgi:AMIN domain